MRRSNNRALRRADGSLPCVGRGRDVEAVTRTVHRISSIRWRLIRDGRRSPSWNMAVDEAIMKAHSKGMVPPTLRLYGWNPPAVSIGHFQSLEREVDLDACRRMGIGWVRRPTGGRAVLHEHEVTYSVVVSEELLPGGVLETYCILSRGIVHGLRSLGLEVEMAQGPFHEKARNDASSACFDAPSWYEVMCGGKKIVGSAQTRRDGVILQHGSVVIRLDPERTISALRFASEETRRAAIERLNARATGIGQILNRPVGYGEVCAAIVRGFEEGLGIEFEEGELTPAEETEGRLLETSKYDSDAWNRRR